MQEFEPLQPECAEVAVDQTGAILGMRASGHAARIVEGLAPGECLFDRIHQDDRDIAELLAARALRRPGEIAAAELRWQRSEDRWVRLSTTFASQGRSLSVVLRYDDVGALRRAEGQMRRAVEGSAQGIVVRTRSEVLYMNDSFAKILGYATHRECIDAQSNVNGMIYLQDLPVVLRHLEARIRSEETLSHYEFRLVHRNGTPIWVETYAATVNWDGKSASLSWITDISERKAIEDELVRSKELAEYANRSKTQFLANMSHELRTPLNAILGFSEVIQHQLFGPVAPKYLDYASDIHKSGRHLLELVNDVLDLSKLEAGKLDLRETNLLLPALAEECLGLLRDRAEETGVELRNELSKATPLLRADERAVRQLLLNFLSNAIKFTPAGGAVRVHADSDPVSGLLLSVTDTGIGMTNSEIEVALSPFGQIDSKLARKHEGTGLGLPICRSLMELHGGDLRVESAPNAGTTLTARFPAKRIVRQEQAAHG